LVQRQARFLLSALTPRMLGGRQRGGQRIPFSRLYQDLFKILQQIPKSHR
jgi:hypothetical protein